MDTIHMVIRILDINLKLGNSLKNFDSSTLLLGNIPELDSMSIVNIIASIEENFDIEIDDDDISAEVFESVGTLAAFIENKLEDE